MLISIVCSGCTHPSASVASRFGLSTTSVPPTRSTRRDSSRNPTTSSIQRCSKFCPENTTSTLPSATVGMRLADSVIQVTFAGEPGRLVLVQLDADVPLERPGSRLQPVEVPRAGTPGRQQHTAADRQVPQLDRAQLVQQVVEVGEHQIQLGYHRRTRPPQHRASTVDGVSDPVRAMQPA